MQVLGLYRTFVVLIVVTIAGMSVFSTMLKAVNERVREIGTLRSIGYRRRHIVALFTIESAMLALASSLAGLLVTAVLVALINGADATYSGGIASQPIPLTVSLPASASAFAVVFLSGVAVLAALFPARRAARLPIPDALGHA
jgi:putative ABC transport system permease protein